MDWNFQMRLIAWRAAFWASHSLATERAIYPPFVLNIEPTNYCNLRCPFCPVSQMAHDPSVARGFLDPAIIAPLLGEIRAWRPLIAINLGGESTLHRDLPLLIEQLSDAGCYVFLDTNAAVLSEEMSKRLLSSGLAEIAFCIDGEGDARSYEDMRKRASFDKTVRNVRRFLTLAQQGPRRPKTVIKNIRYYKPGLALDVPAAIRSLFSDTPPDLYRATWADYWPGSHAEKLAETYEVEPIAKGAYQPCTNLWKKLAISWDGKVYACCLDLNRTVEIGDVTRQSLAEIWNGAPIRALRRMHRENRQNEIALCRNCTMIQRSPRGSMAGLLSFRRERFTPFSESPGQGSAISSMPSQRHFAKPEPPSPALLD